MALSRSGAASRAAFVLLITATVALCVTSDGEVAQLGEAPAKDAGAEAAPAAAAEGAAGEAPGAENELLTPWDRQGLAVIKEYSDYNKHLQDTERKLRERLANPPDTVESIEYHQIPGYKYAYLGRQMDEKTRSECELVCSTYTACKSYSYNQDDRECIWSMGKVKYNPDYSMYIKKLSVEGKDQGLYDQLVGLYIQDKLEPMDNQIEGSLDPVDAVREKAAKRLGQPYTPPKPIKQATLSADECEYSCTQKAECKTFTYNAATRDCILSAVAVHYDMKWTYYEKEEPLGGPSWKKEHAKENDRKEELKKVWIAGSSAKARAKAEKQAKVDKALKDSKSEESEATEKEARARKVFDHDKSRCELAEAEYDAGVKRNTQLSEDLEKANNKVLSTRRERLSAEGAVQASKTYEATKKAELKLTFYDVGEAENKAAEAKEDESQEKKAQRATEEHKAKLCGSRDMTKANYEAQEGKLKAAEAKQKLLGAGELIAQATKEQGAVNADLILSQSDERKSKLDLAVKKSTLEGTRKREAAAGKEVEKKAGLEQVAKDLEVLKKAERKQEDINHHVMTLKEKQQKAKENMNKMNEKESKAENLVKSRKRESDMKAEANRVKKKLKIKAENDAKSEHSSKNMKAEELMQKKTDEQKDKGEMSLKKMKMDEQKKKKNLRHEENTYKDVEKAKEMSTKKEKEHKEHLASLKQDEDDEKYKARYDALKARTLREQEVDAKKAATEADQESKDANDKATADEQHEKTSAAALKKATTEADTKKLMRNELNWKSILTSSNEYATKAQQQKMLAAEDLVQAVAKQQAENCVHICAEGMEERNQKFLEKASQPKESLPGQPLSDAERQKNAEEAAEQAAAPATRRLLQDAPVPAPGVDRELTPAEKANAAKSQEEIAENEEREKELAGMPVALTMPKVEPFTYNGCEC